MARISGISGGNGGNINALRGRVAASFRRLIPETNLLSGAKEMFSLRSIRFAQNGTLNNLRLFFEQLCAVGISSQEDFRRADFIGLENFSAARPETDFAGNARYFLEQLNCRFAYRGNELIIGTKNEVAVGIADKSLTWEKPQSTSSVPVMVPSPVLATAAKPATTALAVTNEAPISKREFKLKSELKNTVVNLLQSGQAEMAAVMLFSSSERSAYESLLIARELIKENPEGLFDGHEKLVEILQLQSDVATAGIAGSNASTEALFLGYLLGRYAAVAPILAAKVIVAVSSSRLLGLFNIPKAIDILSYMEQDSFRANALMGLAAIGETRFMDKVFRLAIASGDYELVRDHFTAALDIVHDGHRECFFSAEEYQGETIFRDKKGAVRIYEAENVPLSDRTDLMRPERGIRKVADFTPDYHLILSIRKLLAGNQLQLAAQLAFSGYQNAVLRFKTLIRLESGEMGALLGAVSQEKRASLLNDLADGLGENNQEVGEKVALALLKVPNPTEYFHELVLGGARFAARKLLLYGCFAFESAGEYGLLYDELEREYPETYQYDYHKFVARETEGCFSSADAPLDLIRKKQLKHYWGILKDENESEENRVMAAEMLGRLNAVEYFTKLAGMGYRTYKKGGRFNSELFIFGPIQVVLEKLDEKDEEQAKLKKWFSKISNKKPKDKPISFDQFATSTVACLNAGLNPQQIVALYSTIADKCRWNTDAAFNALPSALAGAKGILNSEQIVGLYSTIAEKCGENTYSAFNSLPAALAGAKGILNSEQIVGLYSTIAAKCGKNIYFAFNSLPAALAAGLTPPQIVELYSTIAEKCGWNTYSAFNALPSSLAGAKEILNPAQIVRLYSTIAEKCGWNTYSAFNALPSSLAGAKDILSPQQIFELYSAIAEKCGDYTSNAFEALPSSLAGAKDILNPQQIVELYSAIAEKCGGNISNAFKALPSVLKAEKTPEAILASREIRRHFRA